MPSKVSAIIPAYNAAHWLPYSLGSLLTQTFQDWTAVVVDDGSTDDTAQVLNRYQELIGERLVVVRQSNRGLPAARNAAIRQTNSDYVALLDADDIWLPRRLETTVRALDANPAAGLAYSRVEFIDAHGRSTGLSRIPGPPASGAGLARLVYMRRLHFPCPSVTYRRSILERVGLFDESMPATEDRDLSFRVAGESEVEFIPEILAQYRRSLDQMSKDPARMLRGQLMFLEKNYERSQCSFWQRRIALSATYQEEAAAHARRSHWSRSLQSYARSLAYHPFNRQSLLEMIKATMRRSV